jgi:hypothetical protein
MRDRTVSLWSEDPLLGEVVEHILIQHGVRVSQEPEAAHVLHVRDDAIELRQNGARAFELRRPYWAHDLVAALAGVVGRLP